VIVLVRIPGEDAEDAGPDHLRKGMVDASGIAWIVEGSGESRGQADAVIELPQGQQASIGSERSVGYLDVNGQRLVEVEVEE
jgi:hypothetical protein